MDEQYSHEDIENPEGNPFKVLDVALFFQENFAQLKEAHGYSEVAYRAFLSWHQPGELVEKIINPQRFFRVIRHAGKIVGFFESRNTEDSINVQWIFIDTAHQKRGLSKALWDDFWIYCAKQKNLKTVKSFVKESNQVSINMHLKQGFERGATIEDSTVVFTKAL